MDAVGIDFRGPEFELRFLCAKIVGSRCAGRSNCISFKRGTGAKALRNRRRHRILKGCVHVGHCGIAFLKVLFFSVSFFS